MNEAERAERLGGGGGGGGLRLPRSITHLLMLCPVPDA